MVYSKYGNKVNEWSVFFPLDIKYTRAKWKDEHYYIGVQVTYFPTGNPTDYSDSVFSIGLITFFHNNGASMSTLIKIKNDMNSLNYENTSSALDRDIRHDGMYFGGEPELISQLMDIPGLIPILGTLKKLKTEYDVASFDETPENEAFLSEYMQDIIKYEKWLCPIRR